MPIVPHGLATPRPRGWVSTARRSQGRAPSQERTSTQPERIQREFDRCNLGVTSGSCGSAMAWDRVAGAIEPKSRAAVRNVPLIENLRLHLLEDRLTKALGGAGGWVFLA